MTLYTIVLEGRRFRAVPQGEVAEGAKTFGLCRPEDAERIVAQHQRDFARWALRGGGAAVERAISRQPGGIPQHRLLFGANTHGKWRLER